MHITTPLFSLLLITSATATAIPYQKRGLDCNYWGLTGQDCIDYNKANDGFVPLNTDNSDTNSGGQPVPADTGSGGDSGGNSGGDSGGSGSDTSGGQDASGGGDVGGGDGEDGGTGS